MSATFAQYWMFPLLPNSPPMAPTSLLLLLWLCPLTLWKHYFWSSTIWCHYPGLYSQLYVLFILYTFPMIPCTYIQFQLLLINYSILPRSFSQAQNPNIQLCPVYLYLDNLKALQIPHDSNWALSCPNLIFLSINDINIYAVSQVRDLWVILRLIPLFLTQIL